MHELEPELEPTWVRAFSVGGLIGWRSFAGSLVLAFAGAAAEAALERWTDASPLMTSWLPEALISVLGAVWFLVVVRMALRKRYRDFRIALVAR